MSTIPASTLVNVVPSVLGAGGNGVDIIGLVLTENDRVPIGTVLSFSSAEAVQDFFGAGSTEAIIAGGGSGMGAGYFGGYDGAQRLPANILFAQYNSDDVGAYVRGGDVSALTLAQLQAISGSLNTVIDGYAHNVAALNLSAATSFSSAATIIQTDVNAAASVIASFTAQIGAAVTAAISGTTLTVSAVASGLISVGDTVTGGGTAVGTVITALGSGTGGTGTYTVSISQTVGSGSLTIESNVLNVSAVASGTLAVGQTVDSSGTDAVITALGTGTGTTGTYLINGTAQRVASGAMTSLPTPVTVSYDSVSGAFIMRSGVDGAASTMAFSTGTAAASVKFTSATGAVLSQGAAAAEPGSFMDALKIVNQNWVTFFTSFDPDGGSGNAIKKEFADWVGTQENRFCYLCWDTDASPTTALPATASLGYLLEQDGNSGTCLLWEPSDLNLAAFISGAAASIDFTQRAGRITFAFKAQAGLVAGVTNPNVASNLGGNPQVANSYGNGYNFYGAYASANPNFIWFQRGLITGDFRWLDSFLNQVWLNTGFQIDLLTFLGQVRSVPYSTAGNTMIEAALSDRIQAALNFGMFGPGTLSASQIATVNADAGVTIAPTLQAQGYYLQILPASAAVRSARTSPPAKFWYIDNGAVQAINLASVALT
jgi:hypothetical protein